MNRTPRLPQELLFQQAVVAPLRKGDVRKMEILQATLQCLGTVGLDHTNFETIGKLCGMKRPHVAYHFRSRKLLLMSSIRLAYATGQGIIIEHLKAAQGRDAQLKAYVEGLFDWFSSHPTHKSAVGALIYLGTLDEDFRKMNNEFRQMGIDRLFAVLISDGKMSEKKALESAERLYSFITGGFLNWVIAEKKQNLAHMHRHLPRAIFDFIALA